MVKNSLLKENINSLSVSELKELERKLSVMLLRVQKGVIDDDSFPHSEPQELEQQLYNKLLKVQNAITAKKIRG